MQVAICAHHQLNHIKTPRFPPPHITYLPAAPPVFASPLKWLLNGGSRVTPDLSVPLDEPGTETTMRERGALVLAGHRSGDIGGRPQVPI
jgi:hypothetical protein